jgi:hypothetical protein
MSKLGGLKSAYIEYYVDVPVQKYAAMYIGRDEDTIIRWRNEDQEFADAVQKAKAEWIRKRLIATKAEFALERLEKSIFSQSITTVEEKSVYDRYIDSHQIDPNSPNSKLLSDRVMTILLEETKSEL